MKLLRQALETVEASEPVDATVVMRGPLSEVYAQALNIAYAKNPPVAEEQAVMESAAIDVTLAKKLPRMVINGDFPQPPKPVHTLYAISKDSVNENTLIEVSQELVANPPNGERDFICIVDGSVSNTSGDKAGLPETRVAQLTSAMESLVTAYGGKVFTSLHAYANSL